VQRFISKYGLAAHLAILAVAPLFLSPVCVLWLAAFAAVWLVMEPSRIGGESLGEARKRVFGDLVKDPLFWTFALVGLVVAFRCVNGGIAMSYDAETQVWSVSKPKFPILPGAVTGFGLPELASFLALSVVVMGCRQALGRSARMTFLFCASALSGAGGVTLAVLLAMGDPMPQALLACSQANPVYVGSAMGAYLLAGTVATFAAFEAGWLKAIPLTLLCIGGNAVGLFLFSPAYVQVVFAVAELLLLVYAFYFALRRLSGSGEFKFLVTVVISLTLAAVLVISVLPESTLSVRLAPYLTGSFIPGSFEETRAALSAIALKAWKSNPWLGSGLGSYPLDLQFLAGEADWALVSPEQLAPLNGYWFLLAERGIAGAVLIAGPLGFLLWSFGNGLVRGIRSALPHPAAWVGLAALVSFLVEMVVDASFSLSGTMLATAAFLAISACSFPKEKCNG